MADLFRNLPTEPPRSTRHLTSKQRQDDLVSQIKASRHLREIAYEQADRAEGSRRKLLLRRASGHSETEARLLATLRAMAPGHVMVRDS